jgi:acetyl esterase/lipase
VVVLAFGGAFHRGSKEDDAFGSPGECNTAIADYCQMLAARGVVACSIDYRLVQENPDPGHTRAVAEPQRIPRSRVDLVRRMLGLAPASDDMLWRGIEAASDDLALAARYVLAHAQDWHVDPSRLVLGGFSAGARTALNAVFAERVPAAAVVSLSGYVDAADQQRHLASRTQSPPVLLVSAENDLDYIVDHTPSMASVFRAHQVACETLKVPAAGHFYPHDAVAVRANGDTTTVLDGLLSFLQRTVGQP